MMACRHEIPHPGVPNILGPRRKILFGLASYFFLPSSKAKPMSILLNISLFNYLDRPIFDVRMNGTDFGAALARSFYGANAVMVEQPIFLGSQLVTWRLDGPEGSAGNGNTVAAKNTPMLEKIPRDVKWLALHIYKDNTVEIAFSRGGRAELQTDRGRKIVEAWRLQNAK